VQEDCEEKEGYFDEEETLEKENCWYFLHWQEQGGQDRAFQF
jgi:hypothetical protein